MLKPSLTTFFGLLAMVAVPALGTPAAAQYAAPQESPWAMRAPAAGATPSRVSVQKAEAATPQQQEFARKLVDALYDRNLAAMKQLVAPSTLKCIGKDKEPFLDDQIKKQFDLPIDKKYRLTVTKLPPSVMHATDYATYPMLPTHLMAMEFPVPGGGTATVNQTIGQENDNWYEAQPCPTELGMQRFARLQKMQAVGRERAKAAMARVQEPLKSQLLALIAKRDNADAWKLCMKSLNVDFVTARRVVAMLAGNED
jgi:hypothetical protein